MKKKNFTLKPGQTDYSKIRWAPVVNCVVMHGNKILVVERSRDLNFYPGYWNGISGFLDDHKSLKEKVVEEMHEELGVPRSKIQSIMLAEIFDQEAPKYGKTWIVHPVLVKVKTDRVALDWEARNYKWVTLKETANLKLLPGFDLVLKKISALLKNKK